VEATIHGLELVGGHLPAEIEGTLLRCGPDRQYPPRDGSDLFIDGEGMVHTFRFSGGQVDYMSRWVRTERYVLQDQARRALFGRYRNRFTNDPSAGSARMGTANTNLVFHAGKLLAHKEDDLPYELDPETLETPGGHFDFSGAITSVSLSAHPKLDLVHDEMLTFSYQAKGDGTKDIVFYALNRDGRAIDEIWFEMPWPAMVHDFAVTPNYAVFPFFPFITDMEALKRGGPFYQWHPEEETRVAIVPRHGAARDIRWFRGPTMSAGHMMNAYEDGSKLHLDVCLYDGPCFDFFPTPSGQSFPVPPPILTQFTFDLSDGNQDYTRWTQVGLCFTKGTTMRRQVMLLGLALLWCFVSGVPMSPASPQAFLEHLGFHKTATFKLNHGCGIPNQNSTTESCIDVGGVQATSGHVCVQLPRGKTDKDMDLKPSAKEVRWSNKSFLPCGNGSGSSVCKIGYSRYEGSEYYADTNQLCGRFKNWSAERARDFRIEVTEK
jgi:hypothetical protein